MHHQETEKVEAQAEVEVGDLQHQAVLETLHQLVHHKVIREEIILLAQWVQLTYQAVEVVLANQVFLVSVLAVIIQEIKEVKVEMVRLCHLHFLGQQLHHMVHQGLLQADILQEAEEHLQTMMVMTPLPEEQEEVLKVGEDQLGLEVLRQQLIQVAVQEAEHKTLLE